MIRRLLVANRGEIARRIMRTAHSMGIDTVAVYSDGDAGAAFVEEAGSAVALVGRSAAETYLDIDAVIAAARRSGADAVHPGYGFLSENAAFAQAVRDAGLRFVGPPSNVIGALGDKLHAKHLVRGAGVPVLESVEVSGDRVPDGADELSYPVLVKAAAGGGGKGMRVVGVPSELPEALAAAAREAHAAFGDGRLFLEPYLVRARHVEIQIFGDSHGNLVHLFERECSIQRRHQKIVEEAPSPAVSADLRAEMGEAAIRAGKAVGYENAGTVEFLLGADGRFFFLEVNTRLQVEHPVTEAITGLDLVREQLLVADGAPLSFTQGDLAIDGHAIEVRLYAEDPANGFLPSAGRLEVFRPAVEPTVRIDSGVRSGDEVGIEFDPMLAKVIAHAPTRREAAATLALALERSAVHGVVTNRQLLVAILRDEAFLEAATPTSYLADHPELLRAPLSSGTAGAAEDSNAGEQIRAGLARALIAASLAAEAADRARAGHLGALRPGWRNSVMPPERRRYIVASHPGVVVVEHAWRRDGSVDCAVGDASYKVTSIEQAGDRVELVVDGLRVSAAVARSKAKPGGGSGADSAMDTGIRVFVDCSDGISGEATELPRFPTRESARAVGALVAPMPGRVLSVHVAQGDVVEVGQLLVIVEAMKMEHRITAPSAGKVGELHAEAGRQVATGDVLVTVEATTEADPGVDAGTDAAGAGASGGAGGAGTPSGEA